MGQVIGDYFFLAWQGLTIQAWTLCDFMIMTPAYEDVPLWTSMWLDSQLLCSNIILSYALSAKLWLNHCWLWKLLTAASFLPSWVHAGKKELHFLVIVCLSLSLPCCSTLVLLLATSFSPFLLVLRVTVGGILMALVLCLNSSSFPYHMVILMLPFASIILFVVAWTS